MKKLLIYAILNIKEVVKLYEYFRSLNRITLFRKPTLNYSVEIYSDYEGAWIPSRVGVFGMHRISEEDCVKLITMRELVN